MLLPSNARKPSIKPSCVICGLHFLCPIDMPDESEVLLKSAVNHFKSFESVQQLKTGLAHLIRARSKLLHMLDDESDAVNGNTRLIRHLELYRRRSRFHFGFDRLKDIVHDFGTHRVISTGQSPAVTADQIVRPHRLRR
jgi:hypothetical protein